ncbi:CRISPR-associated protein Cas6 [Hydrogenobacter thermophilus TK-6]|uniref:CRISPR-associated endoribonuclease n=1 Tax=Hydrogenobacter thermophilus (strain DSM 6534 / IAM 12695 / TK-6) TaxID=608538 RepID=D3DIQ3_HYDTT|nr:CRISPR-associated endoribonuclease Cas6 [Hydrogenobacter thermophilus]ADO45631.1 CRISPR-associated protein Cas6 [Hydrogenobacter thermophilus TK-6]BAI69705.1 CRISPR-associated protein [Hydrogenobacter thermophilus TK-6]
MILKIKLTGEGLIRLPKSYNHLLQAFFYKNTDPVLSKFLHEIGFVYNRRRFKLFTFSKIIGKLASRQGNLVFFEPQITVYFASPLMDIVSSAVNVFLKRENLFLGENRLRLESVELIKPTVREDVNVRCLSPITVYRTPEGETKKQFFSPWQEEFYELIKNNLIKKYQLIYGKSYKEELELKPLRISQRYKKKIVYKGSLIEAWEGYYNIRGSTQIVKLALEAGLGAKNPQGFGMVEVVDSVEGD